jgi:predicted lipase
MYPALNVVASTVLKFVKAQNAAYPSYTIIVTGHLLGAAIAALAAISIKSTLPSSNLKLYTFGQSRTGNVAFATYVENLIGVNNIFRAVHTYGKCTSESRQVFDSLPMYLPR